MKKIIYILILILCSQSVIAQWPGPYTPMTGKGYQFKYIKIDSGLYVMKPALFEDTVLLKGYSYLNSTPGIGDSTLRLANTRFVMRAIALGGGGGGGTVTSFSAGSLSPLFSTSVATATTTPALTFNAGNTTQYTVLGRKAAGLGAYSFIAADSALIPGLHSEAYYNTKYAAVGAGGTNIYNSDGNISAERTVTIDNAQQLIFDGPGAFHLGKNTPVSTFGVESSTEFYVIAGDDINLTADTVDIIGFLEVTGDAEISGLTTVGSLGIVGGAASIDASGNITGANLAGGSYTPTYTNGANVQGSTTYDLFWKRTSDGVEIWGKIEIDPVLAATTTTLTFTLPPGGASNFGDDTQAGGTGCARDAVSCFAVFSEPTLDELQIELISVGATNGVYSLNATYQIIP